MPGPAPDAQPDDVTFTLTWRMTDGALNGDLEALNISNHPVRLTGKPSLTPIGTDGRPLDTESIMSLEMRPPGYVELAPGDRASSSVTWGGWDGPPCSGRFIAHWPGGQTEIHAQGPPQPTNHGPATNLATSWFDLLP